MSEILQELGRKLVFPIDFRSQKNTERYQQLILIAGAILASLIGFFAQSLLYLVVTYGLAIVVAMVVVLPAYPAYTREKLDWVKPKISM
ncbi:hypothetical protein HG535_0B00400 [Zygotorulaspora mrakii]|uniref:Signal peptidase complex subunit 1 n=1 Tax=Zygotorulaspora mrakii TaxID=42260 RepID=A0A7H9AZG7_ZYGMR|nr:uncharacterized protein HG535_0B00400 [Zygotorulaspora mrakii]QLG71002.1 hypothetical protein HG535_0B00400 [Zygotorulaspora mrakii]